MVVDVSEPISLNLSILSLSIAIIEDRGQMGVDVDEGCKSSQCPHLAGVLNWIGLVKQKMDVSLLRIVIITKGYMAFKSNVKI